MPTEQAKGQTAESLAAQAAKLHKEVSSLRARCDNIDQVLTESYKMLERIKQKKVASINIRLHQFMVHGHSLASHGNQLFPTRTARELERRGRLRPRIWVIDGTLAGRS